MFEVLQANNCPRAHKGLANYHFLISSTDEETCFHQPAKMNAVEAYLLLLGFSSVNHEKYAALNC